MPPKDAIVTYPAFGEVEPPAPVAELEPLITTFPDFIKLSEAKPATVFSSQAGLSTFGSKSV